MLGMNYIDGMKRAETEASQWLLMAAQDLKADVSAQAAICGCTEHARRTPGLERMFASWRWPTAT